MTSSPGFLDLLYIALSLLLIAYAIYEAWEAGGMQQPPVPTSNTILHQNMAGPPPSRLTNASTARPREWELAALIEERIAVWSAEDLEIWREAKSSFDHAQDSFQEARGDGEKALCVATMALNGAARKLMEADSILSLKQVRGKRLLADVSSFLRPR
jgi:hypothetical protein